MPDVSNTGLAQCEDCGHHFQISPRGEIQLGACPDCGGKRMFRMQPNPVQSEGTLRNMVDMETGKDAGGNPDGEGILAPASGRAILTAFLDDNVRTCEHCGWNTRLQPGETDCPRCHWPFEDGISQGIPAELRPEIAGAPLTEGTIMGTEHTDPYDTGAHGRDEYAHSHVIAAFVTAEHQGYTNWETWHTKLMLDNERHLYEMQKRMAEEGWSPEQIRDWTVKHVIGPENKRKIEDAREWNEIPEAERTDPHYEEVAEKSPGHKDIMESWFGGPDLSDTSPNLIDPELVNWDEIHHNINAAHNEEQQYEEEHRRLKGEGLNFAMPGHKDETNKMLDAWMKHHGIMSEDQKTPTGGSAAHHTPFWVPLEHLEQGGSEYAYPEGFSASSLPEIEQQGGYNDNVRSVGWNALHRIMKGQPTPYHGLMRQALETAGYPPEQIEHIMRPQFTWNEDEGRYLPLQPKPEPEPDPRLDQPGKDVFPAEWTSKTAGEMEDIVFGGTPEPTQPSSMNWTPGMKGRGLVIAGEPHTWNAFDPKTVLETGDTGKLHPQYVESLGIDPRHVDWNSGVEIEPDGRVVATGGHDPGPFIAADPRLKHVEENFFPFSSAMPAQSRTNNMDPYDALWAREADVMFDQGPLQNTADQSPPYSVAVQPSEAGVHGAHTGRRGVLSFLDAHINGIPVRGHGGELITKYGFRKSPDFGKPVIVAVHDPAHLPIAVEALQNAGGHSASISGLLPQIQSGEVAAPPGIDAQTLQPLPGVLEDQPTPVTARTASFWSTLGEAALPIAGLALAPETGGASLALDAGEAGALLGGEAAGAAGAGAAEGAAAEGASGTAGGLMSKAMSGAGGVAKAEGVSSLVNQGLSAGEGMLGMGQGGGSQGGGGGYSGPLQQFTHVLAAFVEGANDVFDPISKMRCPHCHSEVIADPDGKDIWCQGCGNSWPVGKDMASLWAFEPRDILETDALKEDHSLLGPVHHGKTADYETPSSVPDVGVKHDDPEDVDQKEFNDQDKSPENPKNPNLQDSGASGEDEVRKEMGKPSQGQFAPDSHGIQRMEMLMPLIERYYHSDESGADDPMLKGLHEMLEAENPGYLDRADVEAAERFMQKRKQPEHVHASTTHESIMPPMQQGNLTAQQEALDPTGLNPSQQKAPSSATPAGGGQQAGHCPHCGGVTQADGSCPQCGAAASPAAAPLPGGPSQMPHPQTFAHTDLLASLIDSANHQGPVTPEQIAAVQQWLIQEGRVDEVPNVPMDPGNPEYAKILAEIQGNPNSPPTVTPEEQTQPPAPQPQAPGGMPVPGMAPGEAGGQPMQPMSSFLPDFTAADNIAPRCPKCGSATTGLVGDQDHTARCHSCRNVWKLKDLVSDENYGQTSIARTALRDERQHGGGPSNANPIAVPAANQEEQTDQGGDEDSSLTWKDSMGAPLKAGQTYQMVNPSFTLPDLVRVERVKPDGIDVTLLGTYANDPSQHDPNMLTSSTPISKEDMEINKLSFEPVSQTADDRNNEPPPGSQAPGLEQVPPSGQTTDEEANRQPDMAAQSSVAVDPDCPRCGHREFTSSMITPDSTEHECFFCAHSWVTEEQGAEHQAGIDLEWLKEDDDAEDLSPRRADMARAAVQSRSLSDIAEKDTRLQAVREYLTREGAERTERVAGRRFTPKEQRELIDEDGVARNSDMLDLQGTHYRVRDNYDSKTNPERVRDSDLFLGI